MYVVCRCPDAPLPRIPRALSQEQDEPVLWRDMWALLQTSSLARGRGVSGERAKRANGGLMRATMRLLEECDPIVDVLAALIAS